MNIVLIGAGPAGEAAAVAARKIAPTADIKLIEREEPGGLCLNKGCIPSKTLLEHVHSKTQNGIRIIWDDLQILKNKVVQEIRSQLETKLKNLKITRVSGTARFVSPTEIRVEQSGREESLVFDKAIIATGTEILYPPPLDTVKNDILNSDTALNLRATPESIIIVGGGAIGCEFACLLNAAGSKVTLVELKEGLLPGEDAAIVSILQSSFEKRGIQIKLQARVNSIKKIEKKWEVVLSTGETLQAEQVLSCVGRVPNPASLNLEKANVSTDKGRVIINERCQTSNPNIYAAGDVSGTRLAHHAAAQGEAAAANALGEQRVCDDRFVPRCLYSWPEVASVGAWKYQLEEKSLPVKVTRAFFKASAKALASGETEGLIQLISEPASSKILGAQIIGPHATELIHIFSVALQAEMTTPQLASVMFAHPTLGELIKEAAKK